jgi:hypothetical protein
MAQLQAEVDAATRPAWSWLCPLCGEEIPRNAAISQQHLIEAHGAKQSSFPDGDKVWLLQGYHVFYHCYACGGFDSTDKERLVEHLVDVHRCKEES